MCYPPVRNTFIHFSRPLPRPRSHSSPPQLFADLVLKQKEVQAKWRMLVEGTLKDDAMANEILYKLAKTHDNTTPKCRARVSEHIYKQIRYCVKSDDIVSDELFLQRSRFFRAAEQGFVEIWCTDCRRK